MHKTCVSYIKAWREFSFIYAKVIVTYVSFLPPPALLSSTLSLESEVRVMSVVDISRFTITKPSGDFWHSTKELLKHLWDIIFGCVCLVILTLLHLCCTRHAPNSKDNDQVRTPEEAGDLESQASHEQTGEVVQKSSTESTRIAERHSHPDEDERLSIGKRNRESELPDTSYLVRQDGEALHESSIQKIRSSEPSPACATADDIAVVITPRKIYLISSPEAQEPSRSKKLKLDEIDAGPPRQQRVFVSPARSRTDSTPSTISKEPVTPSAAHAPQIGAGHGGINVTIDQQHRRNEANNVNDGGHDEVHKPAPSGPFTFHDETSRRFFMNRGDAYTEKELIDWSKLLASRVNTLSASLIERIVRRKPGSDVRHSEAGHADGTERRIGELIKKGLGTRLYTELVEAGQDREELSIDDISASLHDSLDAWLTFCIHLAMKPMLFGLRLRTVNDVEDIFRQMADHEPELARCWKQIRFYYTVSPRAINSSTQEVVDGMCTLRRTRQKDQEEYAILEEIYHRNLIHNEYGGQFALHWRGLLYKYELGLPSYRNAIKRTEEVLKRGILQIFTIAGIELPEPDSFRDKLERIVKDAATLAERTRTGVFSQTVATVIVDPGSPFEGDSMVSVEGDGNEVKCTLQCGLEVVDSDGQRRVLVTPEVLRV
ncbi:hypothetical protein ACEPAI_6879 [Sanghuangporus weigelae]